MGPHRINKRLRMKSCAVTIRIRSSIQLKPRQRWQWRTLWGAGASDGVAAGGDVYHYHQHFLRKHRYIMNDRSVHYHINHVHHHHYHLHGEFPFSGYNGFNGNGNVASLRLDLCARDRGHDRSRSRALASETERLTGYPFCVFMWLHKQTSIHLLVMFQDMRNRCHGANSVTVTMTV